LVPFSYKVVFCGPKRANLALTLTVYFAGSGNGSPIGLCFSEVVSGGAVSSVKEKHVYLLHVFRKRLGYPELKRAVREQAGAFLVVHTMHHCRRLGSGAPRHAHDPGV
jgi:hypothetical protein